MTAALNVKEWLAPRGDGGRRIGLPKPGPGEGGAEVVPNEPMPTDSMGLANAEEFVGGEVVLLVDSRVVAAVDVVEAVVGGASL